MQRKWIWTVSSLAVVLAGFYAFWHSGLMRVRAANAPAPADQVVLSQSGMDAGNSRKLLPHIAGHNGHAVRHLPEPGGRRQPGTFSLGRE